MRHRHHIQRTPSDSSWAQRHWGGGDEGVLAPPAAPRPSLGVPASPMTSQQRDVAPGGERPPAAGRGQRATTDGRGEPRGGRGTGSGTGRDGVG